MSKEKNTGSRSVSLPFPTCLFCWLSWKCLGTEAGGGGAQVGWRRVTRGWAGLGPHHQEGGEEGSRVPSLVRGGGGGSAPGSSSHLSLSRLGCKAVRPRSQR